MVRRVLVRYGSASRGTASQDRETGRSFLTVALSISTMTQVYGTFASNLGDNDCLTPGRVTSVSFDIDRPVVIGSGVSIRRSAHQIASAASIAKHGNSRFTQGVHLWSSGATTLKPLQMDMARIQSKALTGGIYGAQYTYGPGGTGAMAASTAPVQAIQSFNLPTAPGLVVPSGANTTGDVFLQRIIPAGASWASTIGPASPSPSVSSLQAAIEADQGTPMTQPLDPLLITNVSQPADQGYCLRWLVPGAGSSSYDTIGCLHYGQYSIAIGGNGEAALWEYCRPDGQPSGAYSWNRRKTFQYSRPNQVTGHQHQIIIYPTLGPNGEKLTHFSIVDLSSAEAGSSSLATSPNTQRAAGHTTGAETLHQWNPMLDAGYDESPGHATAYGPVTLQARRDLRLSFQLSPLLFEQTGQIVDHPLSVGDQIGASTGGRQPFTHEMRSTQPTGTSITHTINDAVTGLSTGTITRPYAVFNFSGNGTTTPILWHHVLRQAPTIATSSPGAFVTVTDSVEISGTDGDPRHEHAQLSIPDPADAYPRLRNRGYLSARVQVDVTPSGGGSPTRVVLFQGYAMRPHRTKHGTTNRIAGFSPDSDSDPVLFPSQEWSNYAVPLVGMWQRLTEVSSRTATAWQVFAVDNAAPPDPVTGVIPAWKATDVLVALLETAGFSSGLINIADNTIRLAPGYGTGAEDTILSAATNLPEQVMAMCKGYLGQFLYFDETAGTIGTDNAPTGQWILIAAPAVGAAPLWNFVSNVPTAAEGTTAYWTAGALPANTTYSLFQLQSYVVPPEANHLVVYTMDGSGRTGSGVVLTQHMYNAASYPVPGFTNQVDPNNGNYIGHEKILEVLELGLWDGGGAASDQQQTQTNLDFICRRYYTYACQAYEVQPLFAPLVFVTDPVTGRLRKPRFYDPVTWNGQTGWYVRTCSPHYTSDRFQFADYELERIIPYPAST